VRRKNIILLTIALTATLGTLKAQVDPHFSQFYAYPLWLNPALTGVFDGDARVNINFKDQWASISDGYNTSALSADFKTTDKVALGLNILDQTAGTAGYSYFTAYGTFAYRISVSSDETKKVSFGLQAGLINRSFNPSQLQLDDQYDPNVGYNPNLPSGETFTGTNSTIFDASAGVYYYDTNAQNAVNIFGGVSVAHLTDANDPFATDGIKSKLPIRYNVHAGIRINASDWISLTPNLLYIRQQQNQIRAADLNAEFKFTDEYALTLGGMYRIDDAVVAVIGYRMKSLVMGVSYDFNTSPLTVATNGQGGFELSLSYTIGSGGKNPSNSTPTF
jgi:type IX secretion system PorP/SprF family membrane protein